MPVQNCATLEEIALGCARNSGGIDEIYVGDMEDVTAITADESTWEITAMTVALAPINIQVKRRYSEYTDEKQDGIEAGVDVVNRTVSIMLPRREKEKSKALNILGAGSRYLYVFVKDLNGLIWYFPYVQLQTIGGGSGKNRADGSKYDVAFYGEDDSLAKEVDATVYSSVITYTP